MVPARAVGDGLVPSRSCGLHDSGTGDHKGRPFHGTSTTGAQRPAAIVPWTVGVAGPEAAPARSGSEAPDRLWGATIRAESAASGFVPCKPAPGADS